MSDPRRWTETEEERVRKLLRELSKVEPTREVRESLWLKLESTLPPAPGSGSTEGGSPGGAAPSQAPPVAPNASSWGLGLGAKVVAASVVVGLAVWALTAGEPPAAAPLPSAVSTVVAIQPPSAPTPDQEDPPPARMPDASAAPAPIRRVPVGVLSSAPPSPPPRPSRTAESEASPARSDRLREESDGVRRVRRLLRDKEAAAALAELDRLAGQFPAGPLEEEREVLTIEALVMSGSADAGRRRAERFLFERPQSVHAPRVRSLVPPTHD